MSKRTGSKSVANKLWEKNADENGWVTLDIPFESFVSARTRLLGLGRAVEVLEPEALRKSLIDFAEQIVGFYKDH